MKPFQRWIVKLLGLPEVRKHDDILASMAQARQNVAEINSSRLVTKRFPITDGLSRHRGSQYVAHH